MNVVVVESPAKAKTINKYLGPGYKVLACYGHVRDLPAKDGSVEPDDDFAMNWEVDADSAKRINAIAEALKGADKLILATDPDREGEAISWHVLEVLKQKKALKDKPGRARGLQRHHQDGGDRGDGAPARDRRGAGRRLSRPPRARLSGRLHALAGAVAQAAGRALGRPRAVGGAAPDRRPRDGDRGLPRPRILGGRRRMLATPRGETFEARLVGARRRRSSTGSTSAATRTPDAVSRDLEARDLHGRRRRGQAGAAAIPPPPFITSTLQQEAARKLGFGAGAHHAAGAAAL